MSEDVQSPTPLTVPKDSNWRDRVLIGIALVCLALEILYLLHWLRIIQLPLPWEQKEKLWRKIGVVSEKRNNLKNRADGSLSWFPMAVGEEVHLNDTILTGPESTARLEITDQGEILLESNTLLRFSEGPKTQSGRLNLELVQGLLRVKTKKRGIPLQLKSHQLVLGPDSEVVLSKPAMVNQSQVQVKSGEAKIIPDEATVADSKPQPTIALKVGEALQIQPERALARLETKLDIEAKYPAEHARLFAKSNMETVGIYWAGEEAQEVEISRDPDFLEPKRLRTAGRSVQAELTPGKYYWRVRREVAVSAPHEFTLMPTVEYKLLLPANAAAVKEGADIVLKWGPIEGASHYLVEISRTEEFKDYLMQSDVTEGETTLKGIQAGTYYWRVRAVHPEWGAFAPSPVQTFQARKKLTAPKPKGAKVVPGTQSSIWDLLQEWIIPSAHAAEGETVWVEFEWEKLEGADGYRLEIYGTEDRQELLQALEVSDGQAHVELPRRAQYYWRIAAIDDTQIRHVFSPMQKVAVAPETLPTPTEAQIENKNYFPLENKKKRAEGPVAPRELASAEPTGVLWPSSIAAGIGGQGEIERAKATDFEARNSGAAQYFSLSLERRNSWRLRGDYRRNYVGLEGAAAKTAVNRYGADFTLRSMVYGLDLGAVLREELSLIRVAGNASQTEVQRLLGVQVGKNWETGTGNWRGLFETFLQGYLVGSFRGVGAVGEAGLAYGGFGSFVPEVWVRLAPRYLFAGTQNQWTVETLASLRLRFALEKSGRVIR